MLCSNNLSQCFDNIGAVDTDLTPGAVHPDIELMAPGVRTFIVFLISQILNYPSVLEANGYSGQGFDFEIRWSEMCNHIS